MAASGVGGGYGDGGGGGSDCGGSSSGGLIGVAGRKICIQPHYQQQQHQQQPHHRWSSGHGGSATPALVGTLLFCSATFILFQVLVARGAATASRQWTPTDGTHGAVGDGFGAGSGVSSTRLRQLLGEDPAAAAAAAVAEGVGGDGRGRSGGSGGTSTRPERVLECLRVLDMELRALVYQPIPSVEKFSGEFLARMAQLHGGGSGCGSARRPMGEKLPGCPKPPEPSPRLLRLFNRSSGSDGNGEGAWQPRWDQNPQPGGYYSPSDCAPGKSLLILVPYRERAEHLQALLSYLHPVLQGQRLCYTIAVGEQFGNATFNKAKLMNAAFLESMKLRWFDCVIFHDVDLLPTNPFVPYHCPAYPRHLSVSIDKFGYSLPYKQLVGGVLAMPVRYFLKVNGYSNLFWGWGGEDDDMETRIRSAGLLVTRPHPRVARYRMIRHSSRKEILNEVRYKLLYLSSKRYRLDGLNSLNYTLISSESRPLYVHFLIDLGQPPKSSSFY